MLYAKETAYCMFLKENGLDDFVSHNNTPSIKARIFPKREENDVVMYYQCYGNADYPTKAVSAPSFDIMAVMKEITENYSKYIHKTKEGDIKC